MVSWAPCMLSHRRLHGRSDVPRKILGIAPAIWLMFLADRMNCGDLELLTAVRKLSVSRSALVQFRLILVAAIAGIGANLLALYIKRSQLLVGMDGSYMLDLATRQTAWHIPWWSSSFDFFEGIGDVFFGMNFTLLPSYAVGLFFTNVIATKVAIYLLVGFEMLAAIIIFGRALGVSYAVSVAAAAITIVSLFPLASPTLIYAMFALAPQFGTFIAYSLLIAAAFVFYGRRGWLNDLPLALVIAALLAWLILIGLTSVLLGAPFLLLCAVSAIIAAPDRRERTAKIALLLVLLAAVIALGPGIYLAGTILDTAAVFFPAELTNDRATFYFASILFHWSSVGPVGPLLVVLGVMGAAAAIFDRSQPVLRIFGITLLTYLGTRLTFAAAVILIDFWRGPAALYFEFFVVPLYAIFATSLIAKCLAWIWRLRGWTRVCSGAAILIITFIEGAIAVALAATTRNPDFSSSFPPEEPSIIRYVADQSKLDIGGIFRGRTVNMLGQTISEKINWMTLHGIDGSMNGLVGNDLRLIGLHYYGIPGLFEYSPTISPFFYAFTTRLLGLPGDKQTRNVLVLRRLNPEILRLLGVRFIITDAEYRGPAALRSTMALGGRTLFLYELADVNVGQYSPTRVVKLRTAPEILEYVGSATFDSRNEVVSNAAELLDAAPVAARRAEFRFFGAKLHISAESDGNSVLVLPLEYSRCVAMEVTEGSGSMFRANLLQVGIVFSKKIDAYLSLDAGAFLNPACRVKDFLDARALLVGDIKPL